jgi:hypothetical protein
MQLSSAVTEESPMPQIIHRTEAPTLLPAATPTAGTAKCEVPHELIAALAQELWEEAGKPGDRDLDFWLRAEAELKRRFAGTGRS